MYTRVCNNQNMIFLHNIVCERILYSQKFSQSCRVSRIVTLKSTLYGFYVVHKGLNNFTIQNVLQYINYRFVH